MNAAPNASASILRARSHGSQSSPGIGTRTAGGSTVIKRGPAPLQGHQVRAPEPPRQLPPSQDNVVPIGLHARSRMLAAPTDAELLARCRQADSDAWDLLVSRYERLIYSVAMRNGVTPEDAADITQTTFVALIDSLDRIQDETRLASWLMTVARRQAWRLRSSSRRTIVSDSVPDRVEDPIADWALQTAVHDALGQLGGTCRDLLLALFFDPEEPSYAEIARRFGRSIGGIGPLRGRCLERLRNLMSEGEDQ
ncbi:RNA polymerase sigma factor (sigma-70 family) [Nocardioides daedukensis]|uniref:RNA polymerase sigma factor (Sigma-70 family) n=1 Tax=Nocardioides daedukensis TaxID=634462 RepID=A0A7Y9UNG7_9ACTN|nr:sigma-70 family RNA polymerase sigma factor [Nocardioides daedukensis]NYG58543.1 RNA polymerase sigma factor (sigma-70 family) [Nocardioides daedukensis]